MSIIRSSIDVSKITGIKENENYFAIPKAILAKGKYFNFSTLSNKNGVDQWGNTHMVTQDVTKEERLAGKRGPILGNGKEVGGQSIGLCGRSQPSRTQQQADTDSDLQF